MSPYTSREREYLTILSYVSRATRFRRTTPADMPFFPETRRDSSRPASPHDGCSDDRAFLNAAVVSSEGGGQSGTRGSRSMRPDGESFRGIGGTSAASPVRVDLTVTLDAKAASVVADAARKLKNRFSIGEPPGALPVKDEHGESIGVTPAANARNAPTRTSRPARSHRDPRERPSRVTSGVPKSRASRIRGTFDDERERDRDRDRDRGARRNALDGETASGCSGE